MSRSPTSRSPDLRRLAEEGYDLTLLGATLLVRRVPYVSGNEVRQGTLVVTLKLSGDMTAAPDRHIVHWIGRTPCDVNGQRLDKVVQLWTGTTHAAGVVSTHTLCNKPVGREFYDYHEMVSAYVALLGTHAEALAPGATAGFGPTLLMFRQSPTSAADPGPARWTSARRRERQANSFAYADTASARAGIDGPNLRLAGSRIGIIGLGGTGSHVLDLVAKTPVAAIHLYDGDVFEQHSAFRAPGAASLTDVSAGRRKVHHFAAVYSAIHTGIVPHAASVGPENLDLIDPIDFAFVCIDDGEAKRPILERLSARGVPWIDVGMGLRVTSDGIVGALRITIGLPGDHDAAAAHVPMGRTVADAYSTNVQVGDLNALNAALAVVEWKRMRGFYPQAPGRLNTVFVVEDGGVYDASDPG